MFSISRCVLRWGLIGAVGLGALAFLAGPDRISTGFAQLKATVESAADEFVDDPVALRHQLQQLEYVQENYLHYFLVFQSKQVN